MPPTKLQKSSKQTFPVVIIDDGNMRGFLAPAENISREDLEEMLKFFKLSSSEYRKNEDIYDERDAELDTPEAHIRYTKLLKEAKEKNDFVSADEIRKEFL